MSQRLQICLKLLKAVAFSTASQLLFLMDGSSGSNTLAARVDKSLGTTESHSRFRAGHGRGAVLPSTGARFDMQMLPPTYTRQDRHRFRLSACSLHTDLPLRMLNADLFLGSPGRILLRPRKGVPRPLGDGSLQLTQNKFPLQISFRLHFLPGKMKLPTTSKRLAKNRKTSRKGQLGGIM